MDDVPFKMFRDSVSYNGVFGNNLKLLSVSFSKRAQFFIFAIVTEACSSSFSFIWGFFAGLILRRPFKSDKNSSL